MTSNQLSHIGQGNNLILYVENSQDSALHTKKPDRINKFSQVAKDNINKSTSFPFLCKNNEQTLSGIKKTVLFTIASEKNEILRKKFTTYMDSIYNENCQMFLKVYKKTNKY